MSLNKAMLIGNLGKDPELSYTQSGTPRCKFSLATNESYTNKEDEKIDQTEWHNIVVWGKQAENCAKFLSKGRQVYIEGKIQTRSWDDEQTGQKKYMTEINAQVVRFLGGKQDGGGRQGGGYQGGGGGGGYQDGGGYDGPGGGPDDDDIPF